MAGNEEIRVSFEVNLNEETSSPGLLVVIILKYLSLSKPYL